MAEKASAHYAHEIQKLQDECVRWRQMPHSNLPGNSEASLSPPSGSHTRDIVDKMVAYVRGHYQKPCHLGGLANELKMNAAYLSHLFSQTMGIAFHQYRDKLRLAKAQELLSDPLKRICEVADAAG